MLYYLIILILLLLLDLTEALHCILRASQTKEKYIWTIQTKCIQVNVLETVCNVYCPTQHRHINLTRMDFSLLFRRLTPVFVPVVTRLCAPAHLPPQGSNTAKYNCTVTQHNAGHTSTVSQWSLSSPLLSFPHLHPLLHPSSPSLNTFHLLTSSSSSSSSLFFSFLPPASTGVGNERNPKLRLFLASAFTPLHKNNSCVSDSSRKGPVCLWTHFLN